MQHGAVRSPATGSRKAVIIAHFEERLRRLALQDDRLMRTMLAIDPGHVEASGLDPKACALIRLGALVTLGAPWVSFKWGVEWALAAGATADEIVGALMAVAPIVGVTRVVAAVPEFALALGIDIDAALEAWNGDPAEGS